MALSSLPKEFTTTKSSAPSNESRSTRPARYTRLREELAHLYPKPRAINTSQRDGETAILKELVDDIGHHLTEVVLGSD